MSIANSLTSVISPKIYFVCVESRQQNIDFGISIDFGKVGETIETIEARIETMLSLSPADTSDAKWEIGYYEGWQGYDLDTFFHDHQTNFTQLLLIARGIVLHGAAFAMYANYCSMGELEMFDEVYQGEYRNISDFVREYLERRRILESLEELDLSQDCIDLERVTKELFASRFVNLEYESRVYVYARN